MHTPAAAHRGLITRGWGVPNPAGTFHHTPHGAAPERSVSIRDAQRLSGLGYAIPMANA